KTAAIVAFAAVFGGGGACDGRDGPWTPRPYYDIYDEAVNLYYKPPRRPEQALTLMERACRSNSDGQDILCYNLGVLLELENSPADRILAAYERAQKIRPHALYQGAIQRLDPRPDRYESSYLQTLSRMTEACRAGRGAKALQDFRRAVQAAEFASTAGVDQAPGNAATATLPPRESFAQPFFAQCMADRPEYARLLERLPATPGDLEAQLMLARADLDPFHTLWDVELNLRGLADGSQSKNPATAEWHDFIQNARRGQGAAAALHLRAFFDVLEALGRDATQKTPANQDPGVQTAGIRRRVQAFKRAAAVLILNDPYFHRVRGQAAIQSVIRPILK
ncbi:MAG: hypothetical protein RIF32_12095, partial [Leptospirales bacterium]